MGCGPLDGSVMTVTMYTVSVQSYAREERKNDNKIFFHNHAAIYRLILI